jgi:hypothetical protein
MCSARLWRLVGLITTTMTVVASGCGEPATPERTTEATVKGTVTVKGRPLTGGKVTFDSGGNRPDAKDNTSPIGPDGTFSVKTLAGENRVVVDAPVFRQDRSLGSGETTSFVNEGENTVNLAFPPGP